MNARTGGPVFPATLPPRPQDTSQRPVQHHGITLRQWYATHAPAAPDWFKYQSAEAAPVFPETRVVPDHWDMAKRTQLDDLKATGFTFAPDPEVTDFFQKCAKAKAAVDEWRNRQREAKFFAWRFYYADMMIKTGSPS
jgi:hypothetical protein